MDTDEGARITRRIAEGIRGAQGRTRAGSDGHVPDTTSLPIQRERRRTEESTEGRMGVDQIR